MNPLVLIVGSSGSGKSALGLDLAKKYGGAILNCDSLQTYRRLDIGTAKPTPAEQKQVPHFLFDILSPGEVLTAGDYRRAALQVLERELPTRIIFGVGGSGFYIQALEKGMFDVPKANAETDRAVREDAERNGMAAMYKELESLDPEYADRINPNDSYRILRSLIIIRESGKKVSALQREFKGEPLPYPLLKFGLAPSREELLPRIQVRTRAMLEAGLLDEVRSLLDEGHGEWPALMSVGYKECVAVLQGRLPEAKLESTINEKTIQLAKKQRTWFKRDKEIHWLPVHNAAASAESILAAFLDTIA